MTNKNTAGVDLDKLAAKLRDQILHDQGVSLSDIDDLIDLARRAEPSVAAGDEHQRFKEFYVSRGESPDDFVRDGTGYYKRLGMQDRWIAWSDRAALASPAVPEGYKLVPIEPTPEMLMNADIEVGNVQWDHSQAVITDDEARAVWKQMIEAAPAVSQKAAPVASATEDTLFDMRDAILDALSRKAAPHAWESLVSETAYRFIIKRRASPAAQQPVSQMDGAAVAWLATDLDGRGDVAFTKDEARRRAGENCTEFVALVPAATTASESGDLSSLPFMVDTRVIAKHYASATLLKDQCDWPGAVMLHFSDNAHAEFAFEVLSIALTAGLAASSRAQAPSRDAARKALESILYESNGRWYIGMHGDSDVTELVREAMLAAIASSAAQEAK